MARGCPSPPALIIAPLSAYRRHEVLTAAAATAAEAEEVGERRRVRRRDPQPDVAAPVLLYGTEELVGVVDAGGLSFAVHRNVRLDARVPARVDAAPDRLLKVRGAATNHREQESRDRVVS